MQLLYLVSFESYFKFCDYNLFSRQKVENSLICATLNMWKIQMLYLVSFVSKFKFCDYNLFSRQKVENSRVLPLKARINVPVVYINHKAFLVG